MFCKTRVEHEGPPMEDLLPARAFFHSALGVFALLFICVVSFFRKRADLRQLFPSRA